MEYINFEKKIKALSEGDPITFAHIKSYDHPEEHRLHLNDHLEIYIYISGETHYIVEDNYYSLSGGDILIIPPHSIHVPVLKKPCDYERFYLLLPMDIFNGYAFDPLIKLIIDAKKSGFRISLQASKLEEALIILYRISDICRGELTEIDMMLIYSLVTNFLCILSSQGAIKNSTSGEKNAVIPKVLKDILRYIGSSAEQITSPGAIARRFHISLPYLSALFKKHVGVTTGAYLRTKKVAVAKRLLEEGNSVTYACYESGFGDSSYFIKIFKECVGVTPNKYKSIYSSK